MVKSLPYLPTKTSMSIRSRISLKPRKQHQSTGIHFHSNKNYALVVPAKTTSSLYAPSSETLRNRNFIYDVTSSLFKPRYCQNEHKPRHQQATHFNDENLNTYIDDGHTLPYLPSCGTSSTEAHLSSKIYRLKPRSTSKQMMIFLR